MPPEPKPPNTNERAAAALERSAAALERVAAALEQPGSIAQSLQVLADRLMNASGGA